MMDWKECTGKNIAKSVKTDKNMISSLKGIAEVKIESADKLPDNLFYGKITLLYDALREYLECMALENGYKIYNHECYSSFLKEIMYLDTEAELFDELRKVRNSINYYGRKVSEDEAEHIISRLKMLIKQVSR